ncbi:unnamed protein product, partial [Scytosiphon promiscuus]
TPRSILRTSTAHESASTPVAENRRGSCGGQHGGPSTTRGSVRTPTASVKRYARDSGARMRGTGGGTGSDRKRRRRRPSGTTSGLCRFDANFAEKEWRLQSKEATAQARNRMER